MATKRCTDPAGNAQGFAHWHSLSGIRLLMLPFVLGWCSTFAHSAMEEMMIAPIEVIEEWGCYNTEIRLTCGNLESKIAILEARFTPRCMEQRTENCVYMDEHSIAHPFASQKVDKLILEETEAGRRFLATLRRNHERELEASDGPGARELTADGAHRREGTTIVAARSLAKDKRSSLRATLEHLIVRYLRRLTSDDDADGDDGDEPGGYEVAARYRRQSLPATDSGGVSATVPDASTASNPPATGFSNSMEITLLTNDTDTNLTESWEDEREQWGEDRAASNQQPPVSSLPPGTGAMEPRAFGTDAAEGYASTGPVVSGLMGTQEVTGEASVSVVRGAGDDRPASGDSATGANGDSVLRDNGDEVEYNLPNGSVPSGAQEADGRLGELRQQRKQQKPKPTERHGECDSVRKRVSQLDRFELERSMRNGSFREYNIRNALNYRCSGKNHCSFVFSQDHPFAVVWKEGTVRIKYICMDDFRISKYCGEHLIVGNEVHWEPLDGDSDEDSTDGDDESYHPAYGTGAETAGSSGTAWRHQTPNEPTTDGIANGSANDVPGSDEQPSAARDPNEGGEDLRDESLVTLQERHYAAGGSASPYRRLMRAGEPRAEALQAATVHSFHNLKILKPVDDEEEEEEVAMREQHQQQKHPQQHQHHQQHNDTDMDRNQQEPEVATRSRNRQRQKVFSQDFRVLKILPSNLDVVEDIKQIGNEYYFKKDVEVVADDRENEIVDSAGGRKDQPAVNSTTTGDGDTTSNMTETLDIVVLPAPTKDIEIYDNELMPDEAASSRPDDDISVIGLITPPRIAVTSSMTTASGEGTRLSTSSTPLPPTGAVSVETTLGHWDVDRLDLPEPAEDPVQLSGENRTSFAVDESAPPFSFNNRTFQTMQETVRKEFDESQGPYPPLGGYDDGEEDDFEDEDDADEDDRGEQYGRGGGTRRFNPNGGRLGKSHKKHMSVQRTLLKHPLRQGFLMTPSYPKYYIGDSTCRWTLYAGVHQRIKLTVLDLALRYDDECRDYLQVVDLNTNQTLFHSCTESSRPIEIVSIQERLEVSVRTTTKVIYPKRGVLVHYTALGCELPSPTPGHMRLVRRTEHRVKYVCDPLHVFPDTGESVRELICTAKHTWNRPLPACIEKRATEGSGLVSHYEQKRRYSDSDNMSDKQADTVYDILIPSLIIAGLFVVNGIVFAVIMRYRNKRKQRLDLESKELAEL
ncbi:uncharacterized protein LOC128710935 [Anopheles marshallii]|uniref:uncharacterized protein LOC128710935 n=1 Tax=Anopheles marshallii TaxID=1521116 RepID=UPI00237C3D93|nr:uncharacterized protein LOC128710935 [Anopheles marshallii]